MQVILKADVDHLGYALDVVEVKRGYWRNYLRPRKLAETATPERVADLTAKMERRRAAEARNENEAGELRDLLNRTVLTISAHAGPQGKLFGSVTAADIAAAVDRARKLRLDPKKVKLDEPIKALGTFMVPVEVFAGVMADIKTIVVESKVSEEELARIQVEAEAAEQAAIAAADAAAAAATAEEAANPPVEPVDDDAGADGVGASDEGAAAHVSAPEGVDTVQASAGDEGGAGDTVEAVADEADTGEAEAHEPAVGAAE